MHPEQQVGESIILENTCSAPQLASQLAPLIEQMIREQCHAMHSALQIQRALLEEDVQVLECRLDELESHSVFCPRPDGGHSGLKER